MRLSTSRHFVVACALAAVLALPTFAQRVQELPDGGFIIIHENQITVRAGSGSQPRRQTIPPDEDLRAVELSDELLAIVSRLDHPDYWEREAALEALVAKPGDNLPFYALLARASEFDLSAEQRHRMMTIVRERIMDAAGGAIGISLRVHPVRRGDRMEHEVEVTDLLPGLPAIDVLHVDDRIIAIDGEPFQTPNDMTTQVQMRRPGEKVTLTVLRRKRDEHGRIIFNDETGIETEKLEVPIELGSTANLRDPETGRPQINPTLVQQRQQEVAEMEQRFRQQPRRLELEGELPGLSPTARRLRSGETDPEVEQHPSIQLLRRYRELVQARAVPFDPAVLQQQLNDLRMAQLKPGLSEQERLHLERVADRFIELMREF